MGVLPPGIMGKPKFDSMEIALLIKKFRMHLMGHIWSSVYIAFFAERSCTGWMPMQGVRNMAMELLLSLSLPHDTLTMTFAWSSDVPLS